MNYTQNYHLPQWEESDRVLMADFNEAMAGIEAGLTEGTRLDRLALDRGRDLYRQTVQQMVQHGRFGVMDSMWANALSSLDEAGTGHGFNGKYGVTLGGDHDATVSGIKETAKEESIVQVLYGQPTSRRASVTFTSDGYGILETVTVWMLSDNAVNKEFPFYITLIRADTGEEVGRAGPFQSVYATNTYKATVYQVNFPLEKLMKYRMEFTIAEDAVFGGQGGFVLASADYIGGAAPLTLGQRPLEATITKQVTIPDYAEGAVAMIRWQGSGTFTLAVGDEALIPARTRNAVNALGAACQETEFSVTALPDDELTVTLEITPAGGELTVFDYGLIWR